MRAKIISIKADHVKSFWSKPPYHRELKVLLSPKIHHTSENLGLGMVRIPPGESGNAHWHNEEQETWFILSGRGKLVIGEDSIELVPNMVVVVPFGVQHQIINDGNEELEALFIFTPAGPEEDFIVS